MRAREPDCAGHVERDGVRVGYEVYGTGDPAVLLLPTWSIVPSQVWKLTVPHLARHGRVVTFDPRGNGRSDHPRGVAAYAPKEFVADALDVLDATGTERAVLVALSRGNMYAARLAADHPERVLGWVAIGPYLPGLGEGAAGRALALARFNEDLGTPPDGADPGWDRYNRHAWLRAYPEFTEFFFRELLPEAHSTKPLEDCLSWARGIEPERLVESEVATSVADRELDELLAGVRCPVVVVHGTDDRAVPVEHGRRLAGLTHGSFVPLAGAGHLCPVRHPVAVNQVIGDFVELVSSSPQVSRKGIAMRAREPDESGYVERDGVKVAYESFGDGEVTVVFFPVDLIVHSRAWKAQVPYLARHFRVVTIDPRGNGLSDRPSDPAAYADLEYIADTIAVMDHLEVERAVLVGLCYSAWQALILASLHPDRVVGVVAIAPWALDRTPPMAERREAAKHLTDELPVYEGWDKYNYHHWREDWTDFVDFFFGQLCSTPHSTKLFEDVTGWARESTGELQVAASKGPEYVETVEQSEEMLSGITCPVLVIHGTDDRCQPQGRFDTVARLTGAERVVLEGAGHLPHGRDPVVVNHAIKDFVDRVTGTAAPPRTWVRGADRRPRVLYLSSPIGLGHVRRDLAIADALREQRPDVEVQWLTQSPVMEFLEQRGETVHPASAHLVSESTHFESESGEHDLHAFQAIRRMDEILVNNFMVFDDLVARESFDLWVGDEAWDLDHFLHENPELKRAPFVWMTDFVGWVPMADGGEREAMLAADYNAEMVEHVARYPSLRDRSVFVGDPADVVDLPLGPDLPGIREWTQEHFDFSGYVMGERPDAVERTALRARLSYSEKDVLCLVSVGGSGVGTHLLKRVAASYDEARRRIPNLRMIVVTGPRIDPASIVAPEGVEVHGFLPDLDLHHAACDIAVVQGGLSTTMELTASGRPFLYFPLGHHFEQQIHVRHRLERHNAGRCMDYRDADPSRIAEALVEELRRPVSYVPVPTDGAVRAAQLVAELI